jgi:hypothetical protein
MEEAASLQKSVGIKSRPPGRNLLQGNLNFRPLFQGIVRPVASPDPRMKLYLAECNRKQNPRFEGPSAAGRSHAAVRPGE